MRHLDLSWLGLGPTSVSPWLLFVLVGTSWLLAHCLIQIFTLYGKCHRLRGFSQPPKRNWFWGHLGMSPPTEQGMKEMTELVATYPQGFMTWLGPVVPLIHLCHPDIIRSVLSASGTHRSWWWCGCGNLRTSSPDSHASVWPLQ